MKEIRQNTVTNKIYNKIYIKIIAIVVVIGFISYDITWATGGETPLKTAMPKKSAKSNLISLKIPPKYGEIKETFISKDSKSSKLIIHIQDAHVNYEAQKNLAFIIEELIEEYKIRLILVEGGKGNVGLSHLKKYPKEKRLKIADKYLKEGKISGEEYLDITSDYLLKIYGLEKENLYQDNTRLFFEIEVFREEAKMYLAHIEKKINLLKQFLFNRELLNFDKEKEVFNKDSDLLKYASYLNSSVQEHNIELTKHSNYNTLYNLKILEKNIDFEIVKKERDRLIDLLSKILYKHELNDLISKSLEFKLNRIPANEYYSYLKNLANNAGIIFGDYKSLSQYIEYIGTYEQIDLKSLFGEINLLENEIKNKYFTNNAQRKLNDISYCLSILIDFFNLELLPSEYAYYAANESNFSISSWVSFINRYLEKYNIERIKIDGVLIDRWFEKLKEFYKIAIERDYAFVDNALKIMDTAGENTAIVITGGFHTLNLTHFFREKHISYIVISPKITKSNTDEELYRSVLELKYRGQLRPKATKETIVVQLIEAEMAGNITSISDNLPLHASLETEPPAEEIESANQADKTARPLNEANPKAHSIIHRDDTYRNLLRKVAITCVFLLILPLLLLLNNLSCARNISVNPPGVVIQTQMMPRQTDQQLVIQAQDQKGIQKESIVRQAVEFPTLSVEGAVIKANGTAFSLKGVALADPAMVAVPHYNEKDVDELVRWGVNAIRLPLHPNVHSQPKVEIIDRYIEMAHKRGIWVIIDYHDFGRNLLNPDVIKWWQSVATRYAGRNGIIYELFNEPHSLTWQEWRNGFNKIIDAIREIDRNKLLLIGGLDWGYDLRGVRDGFGIVDEVNKFGYAIHPYPGKRGSWENRWGYLMSDNIAPVVVTEFGYEEDGSGKEYDSNGSSVRQLFEYIRNSHTRSWVAWCYHPEWKPRLISDWNHTKTEFGNDVRNELANVRHEEIVQKRFTAVKLTLSLIAPLLGVVFFTKTLIRRNKKAKILKKLPKKMKLLKDMFTPEQLEQIQDLFKTQQGRIELAQTLIHRFPEFAKRSHITRGGPSNESIAHAISFLIALLNRQHEIDKPLPTTFDKNELDDFIGTLDEKSREELFKALDNLASRINFENLDIALRYIFIKLLTYKNRNLITNAASLSSEVKTKLINLFENGEEATFAAISKHLVLPVVSKRDYKGFNNARPMRNTPMVLLIGSYMTEDLRGGLFTAPQLALHRISSYLEMFGVPVDVYDVDLDGIERLEKMIKEDRYDFIGFSVLHPTLKNTLKLIYKVHDWSPDSILLTGGQGAAFNYQIFMEHTPIDVVVRGFGEFPMVDMVMDYDANKTPDQFSYVRGLYIKSTNGDTITTRYVEPYTMDDLRVVSLAIDFSGIPYERYWKAVKETYSTTHLRMMRADNYSRTIRLYCETHCPMGCDFCSSTHFLDDASGKKQKVRLLSAQDTGLLMKRAIREYPDVQAFYFNDDDFMISETRVRELCEIIDRDFATKGLHFICMSRADDINYPLLERMKQSGFGIVSFGIESFSNKTLRDIGKKLRGGNNMGEIAVKAVEDTLKAGITPRINFILFYPTITLNDLQITVNTATELIAKGAPPTYYAYVETYPGASILTKGYEMEYETFKVEGTEHEFRFPARILPVDEKMRTITSEALRRHEDTVSEFKTKYDWKVPGRLPTSVDTLILFYDLYRLAGVSTVRIEEVIEQLMKTDEQRKKEAEIDHQALKRISAAMEILEVCEKNIKEALEEANGLLSNTKDPTSSGKAVVLLRNRLKETRIIFELAESIRNSLSFDNSLLDRIAAVKNSAQKLTGSTDLESIKKLTGELKIAISDLQTLPIQNKGFDKLLNSTLSMVRDREESLIQDPRVGTGKQKKAVFRLTEHITVFTNILLLASLDESVLKDLPREAEFKEAEESVSPRVVYKNLMDTISFAEEELRTISAQVNPSLRSLLFPNQKRRVQIGAKGFEFEETKDWRGWIYRGAKGKKAYKDLIIEEVPAIISGLTQDLRVAKELIEKEKLTITEAIESARKERSATIERNVSFFEGWRPEERAYKSLKSRYALPLIKLISISLIALVGIGYYIGHPVLFPLQVIDTAVSWLLLGILAYITYLGIYGFFAKSGQFRIHREDIAASIPIDILIEILPKSAKQRLVSVKSTKTIISMLTDKEFKEVLTNPISNICLFVSNLSKAKKLDILSKLDVNTSNLDIKQATKKLIEIIINLLNRRDQWQEKERNIINDTFPLQAIIIPAVNDPNIIEQVNHKVRLVDYPNVIFLLALEERDKRAIQMVEKAKADGELPQYVVPYFGSATSSNKPGQQEKPQNKPKTVNKTIAHMQAVMEGLSKYPKLHIEKLPDFLMIWDLEDDPGVLQVWSMLIADTNIRATVQEIESLMMTNEKFDPERMRPRLIRKNKPELYKHVRRWGIDLKLPLLLAKRYAAVNNNINTINFKDSYKRLKHFITVMGIKTDIELLANIERGLQEVEAIKARKHKYDIDTDRLEKYYKRLLAVLDKKYSSKENFALAEFERRVIPVDYQGILVAKMFGENQMSHLEWIFWFDLILPGFSAYRFDKTIIPVSLIGAVLGGIFYGVFGALIGTAVGGVVGLIIGRLMLSIGLDARNMNGLAFSAGTSSNFHFDTLAHYVSAYPEYNVAEDWAVALNLAKKRYRTLLVNGYQAPTYEDSLPPLGPRWWAQHSRWIGGHFQSIPQVIYHPIQSIKDYGFANWFHSFASIILLSISGPLFAYTIIRTVVLGIIFGISQLASFMKLYTLYNITFGIAEQFPGLLWWLPPGIQSNLILFILGPVTIILLGLIPILNRRPDEEDMVNKSIDGLKKIVEEYKNRTNIDIKALFQDIHVLREIADELEAEKDPNQLLERAKTLVKRDQELIRKKRSKGESKLMEDREANTALANIFLSLSRMGKPWKELRKLANVLEQELNRAIELDIKRQETRISQLEEGRLSIGPFTIRIGKMKYAMLQKIVMNFGMIYYYCHSVIAVILYFMQIIKEMDSRWRQTGHRLYGEIFIKKVKETLIQKAKELESKDRVVYHPSLSTNLSRGKIDEFKETHPALDKAANEGRMFAVKVEQVGILHLLDDKALADLIMSNLIRLRSPPYTRKRLLTRLKNPQIRQNLIKGFSVMKEISENKLSDARLVIVIEDHDLPAIVFKDIYNNLIAHSGTGLKTKTPYSSIYIGYNLLRSSISNNRIEGLKQVIAHEVRDLIRDSHISIQKEAEDGIISQKEADIIEEFYDEIVGSTSLVELPSKPEKAAIPSDRESSVNLEDYIKLLTHEIVTQISKSAGMFVRIVKSETLQKKSKPTILALDTDIGNIKKYALPVVMQLQRESDRRRLGNVYFVRGSGDRLEGYIKANIEKLRREGVVRGDGEVDIVLVGKKDNVINNRYREIQQRNNTFITEINDEEILEQNYIPVSKILTFALVAAFNNDYTTLNILYNQITGLNLNPEDFGTMRDIKFFRIKLPKAEPVDYGRLKEMYKLLRNCLVAA